MTESTVRTLRILLSGQGIIHRADCGIHYGPGVLPGWRRIGWMVEERMHRTNRTSNMIEAKFTLPLTAAKLSRQRDQRGPAVTVACMRTPSCAALYQSPLVKATLRPRVAH